MTLRSRIFTKKNLVWLLAYIILPLFGLELAGRYYLTHILHKSTEQKFRFNSYRIYEHVPGFKEGDGNQNWIEINGQGFRRSAETSLIKPKNTYRIFLMGASAAHGISSAAPHPIVHLYQNETIDAQLEKKLKEKHKDKNFEVINAAVTGYETFQHTAYILSELLNYHPDLVVFFDGNNDHFINNPLYDPYKDKEYKFWEKRLQSPSFAGGFDYFMLWLSKFSAFGKAYMAWKMQNDAINFYPRHSPVLKYNSDKNAILNHQYIAKKTFLRSIETNITILKNNNIPALVSLQPILVLRNKDLLSAEEKKWLTEDQNIQKLYPYVVKELTELCKKNNTSFVDLNPDFNNHKLSGQQLFIDYCHLNAKGSEIAANKLFTAVDSIYSFSLKK
jgi:lysophospholipase L1-like esterase